MIELRRLMLQAIVLACVALVGCGDQANLLEPDGGGPGAVMAAAKGGGGGGGGKPVPSTGVNYLSFPVIWSDGVAKTLPGTPEMTPVLNGEWWYQWGTNGTDPNVTPASCMPDPDEGNGDLNPDGLSLCNDGNPGQVDLFGHVAGEPAADTPLPLARAFIQKDPSNSWQAWSGNASESGEAETDGRFFIDWIDWGDNLESVDWYTRSQVRTEVVLFQDLTESRLEYEMRHTDGWGIDEVHGLAASPHGPVEPFLGPGDRATVYSHCARLTIQLLMVDRDDPRLEDLIWVPGEGWDEPAEDPDNPGSPYPYDLINPHIFNGSVHEGGDGPGFYSAEINVKGRIIFGYTWNVRNSHDDELNESGAGDYRLTFSFDELCGTANLNTFFAEGVTEIMVPLEEEIEAAAAEEGEEPGGGATGELRTDLNLTYIDVHILERGGGGGGGPRR